MLNTASGSTRRMKEKKPLTRECPTAVAVRAYRGEARSGEKKGPEEGNFAAVLRRARL